METNGDSAPETLSCVMRRPSPPGPLSRQQERGGRGGNYGADAGQDARQVLQNLLAEADQAVAMRFDDGGSLGVAFRLGVVYLAIRLDGELVDRAVEVQHEAADRVLAPEAHSERAAAERLPEHVLGLG